MVGGGGEEWLELNISDIFFFAIVSFNGHFDS